MIKKKKHVKINWSAVDSITNEIKATGISNCSTTFAAQPVPAGCNLVKFDGGIKGQYLINGVMQETAGEG